MCAGSSEGVDSINTMTVWMELTVLTVLKVPVTDTADSTGMYDRNGSNASNGGTAGNDRSGSINNMTVWMN